jgi:phosphatidylserine/phosphatidylglycerophosphate/cardiolipin synthase-like enzyme
MKRLFQNIFVCISLLGSFAASADPVAKVVAQNSTQNRVSDVLQLTSIEDYPANAKNFFLMSNTWAPNYSVEIRSQMAPPVDPFDESSQADEEYVNARLTCNSEVTVFLDGVFNERRKGTDVSFKIYNTKKLGVRQYILTTPNVESCVLSFKDRLRGTRQGSVTLRNIDKAFPNLVSVNRYREQCTLPRQGLDKGIQDMFLTSQYQSITCPAPVEAIEPLETPESGFKAKIGALLGQEVSDEFIKNANPYAPLDFSKAPKLDAVFVATLVYRNDFYGNVLARVLKYHADHGALVHIMVSDILQGDKDKNLLYKLARENGNIRLKEYRYNSPRGLFDNLNELHRDMHIKIVATLSLSHPENNMLITGGRNIHDGFLFRTTPDYSQWPELTQYGTGKGKDESFVHWNDFEMKIKSDSLVRKIFSHLYTVWNVDSVNEHLDSINQDIVTNDSVGRGYFQGAKPLVRHIVSMPFEDGKALEKFYVDMIDHAQHKIKFSSPYLRPTDAISASLERAIARGVDITIQTRIDLSGDTMDWLYEEMNKESINRFKDKVKLYEWMGNSILHSKFMLIDDEFAFIGSVNVSRRSFVHDIESGFMIYNRDYVQRMEKIFDGYTANSRRVTKKQERKLIPSLLIKLFENEF